jgi:exosortase A-associated hydrolase 1
MSTTNLPFFERAISFDCEGETLIGVIASPTQPASTAVLIVVGGPQYRVGSHRQFVQLARALAEGGHAVLRFDCRGMGDSSGALRNFEAINSDIGTAIGVLLNEEPAVHHVVLWGLCDAASAALMYIEATHDSRVSGLCLANPWLRTEMSHARTQVKHYYAQRLRERGFWVKLLSGRVAWSAVTGLWASLRAALKASNPVAGNSGYARRMLRGWQAYGGPILLFCSGMDYTAKEFIDTVHQDAEWRTALDQSTLQRVDLPRSDHTFSDPNDTLQVHLQTLQWLRRVDAPA